MNALDHLTQALLLSCRDLSAEDRKKKVQELAEGLLGVKISIRAEVSTNLGDVFSPCVSLVEIAKIDRSLRGQKRMSDDELEALIFMVLKEKGPCSAKQIREKIGTTNIRRVATLLKSLLEQKRIVHNGKRYKGSAYQIAPALVA